MSDSLGSMNGTKSGVMLDFYSLPLWYDFHFH